MKYCKWCSGNKPINDFYKHPGMKDGHLNKCKECVKASVRGHYRKTKPARQAYELKRNKRPERRAQQHRYNREKKARNPEKWSARQGVSNAIRDGRLIKGGCEQLHVGNCQGRIEGHHDDYSKPLDVRWLCFRHHREHHGQTFD